MRSAPRLTSRCPSAMRPSARSSAPRSEHRSRTSTRSRFARRRRSVADEAGAEQSPGGPTEDELLEALDRVGVADVIVQALAASASIGFRRVSPDARDLPQARLAIESIRALEPVLRDCGVEDALVRDLEQARVNLQLAYAKAVSEAGSDASE